MTAVETVTLAKQKRLISATRGYLNYNYMNMGVLLDIVAVHHNSGKCEMEWILDSFVSRLKIYGR